MKKGLVIQIRVDADIKSAFKTACSASKVQQSVALRDLMQAAVEYVQRHPGRWITPTLVRYGEERQIEETQPGKSSSARAASPRARHHGRKRA